MSASEETKNQSGGINVNGPVAAQGDLVGRDKIIQNIVLVGQFLDFAKVEGLIPKPSTSSDFESVSAAFEATFKQRLDGDLAQATAFAGEVLSEVIQKKWISGSLRALPFRTILEEVPTIVCAKLNSLGYWHTFCTKNSLRYHVNGIPRSYESDVIWLHSLGLLWEKHFKEQCRYGLVFNTSDKSGYWVFQGRQPEVHSITNEQFRVIMAGLVIDLIRLSSIVSDDIKFWQGLVDLLGAEKKSE